MYKFKIAAVLFMALFAVNVWAAELSMANLTGKWEFLHWAESEAPQETHAVGVVMDFQPDGIVVSEVAGKGVSEGYSINGDKIIYSGKRGEQVWELVSFTPGESLVVSNAGTIMTFRKK